MSGVRTLVSVKRGLLQGNPASRPQAPRFKRPCSLTSHPVLWANAMGSLSLQFGVCEVIPWDAFIPKVPVLGI